MADYRQTGKFVEALPYLLEFSRSEPPEIAVISAQCIQGVSGLFPVDSAHSLFFKEHMRAICEPSLLLKHPSQSHA